MHLCVKQHVLDIEGPSYPFCPELLHVCWGKTHGEGAGLWTARTTSKCRMNQMDGTQAETCLEQLGFPSVISLQASRPVK
jgi:hypothetical protein